MKIHIRWIGWLIVLFLAVSGLSLLWPKNFQKSAPAFVPVDLRRERIEVTVESTGVVEPRNRIEIKPPVGGRIEEVCVVEGQEVKQGDLLARMSSTDRAALLDAARAQGEEALKKWSEIYRAIPLIAPAAGTIIARNTEPGQTLTAADVAFVLSDRLIVRALVDETDIGLIQVGQPVVLTLDAHPNTSVRGKVSHIAYEATTLNNVTVYKVEIIPEDAPAFMKSGMTTTCRFIIEIADDALTLPLDAVVRENGEMNVWVRSPQTGAPLERRRVKTGLTGGGRIQILEGLGTDDRVVRKTFDLPRRKENTVNPFMPRPPGGRR